MYGIANASPTLLIIEESKDPKRCRATAVQRGAAIAPSQVVETFENVAVLSVVLLCELTTRPTKASAEMLLV